MVDPIKAKLILDVASSALTGRTSGTEVALGGELHAMNDNLGQVKKSSNKGLGQLAKIARGITIFTVIAKVIADAMKVFTPVLSMLGTIAKLLSLFLLPIVQFITLLLQPLVLALLALLIPFLQAVMPVVEAMAKKFGAGGTDTDTDTQNGPSGKNILGLTERGTGEAPITDTPLRDVLPTAAENMPRLGDLSFDSIREFTTTMTPDVDFDPLIDALEKVKIIGEGTADALRIVSEPLEKFMNYFLSFTPIVDLANYTIQLFNALLGDTILFIGNWAADLSSKFLQWFLDIEVNADTIFGKAVNIIKKGLAEIANFAISVVRRLTFGRVNITPVRVNDALITKDGKVIEFHPDDDIIASKNGFEGAPVGGNNGMTINVNVSALDANSINSQLARRLASEIGRVLQTQQAGRRTYGFNV